MPFLQDPEIVRLLDYWRTLHEREVIPTVEMATSPSDAPSERSITSTLANISPSWEAKLQSPLYTSAGMVNPGALCYQNSVLQCLLHAPMFVNWLVGWHISCGVDGCIACSLSDVADDYWLTSRDLPLLNEFVDTFRRNHQAAGWTARGQQDAHEFYLRLHEHLLEQCPGDVPVLRALFTMCVQSTLTCNRCGHQAVDDEARPFDLICNFSQPLSIVDLINSSQVLGPEKVEGVLCRNDRHSKHRSDHVKTKIIKVAPEILVALIPRFYQDTKGTLCKRQEQIPITPELDLSNFYEGGRTLKYQLFSIINHVGSLRRGHYVAHARGPSGQWEKLDDSTVSWSTLEKATNPDGGFTPYLLFYQKIHRVEKELVAPLPSYPSRVPTSPPWRTNVDEEFKKFSRPIPVWKANGENLQVSTSRKNPRLEESFNLEEKATSIQAKNVPLPPRIMKSTGILKTPGRQNTIGTSVTPPSAKESFKVTRASGKADFENQKTTKTKSIQNSLSRKRKLGNEYKDDLGVKRLRNNKTW